MSRCLQCFGLNGDASYSHLCHACLVALEPTPQGANGVTGKADAAPAVVGLEPVHWYLENEDEYMSEKLRKEHERLNSYTFKLCMVAHPLYSAADVARLQADLAAMTRKADGFFDALQLAAKINAEGQAREQQLREALETIKRCSPDGDWPDEFNALSLPQDDTALRQWGAKLLRDLVYNRLEGLCNESGMSELLRKADELEAGK